MTAARDCARLPRLDLPGDLDGPGRHRDFAKALARARLAWAAGPHRLLLVGARDLAERVLDDAAFSSRILGDGGVPLVRRDTGRALCPGETLLASDGGAHARLRGILAVAWSALDRPEAWDRLERDLARRLRLAGPGTDLVAAVLAPAMQGLAAGLFEVPPRDRRAFGRGLEALMRGIEAPLGDPGGRSRGLARFQRLLLGMAGAAPDSYPGRIASAVAAGGGDRAEALNLLLTTLQGMARTSVWLASNALWLRAEGVAAGAPGQLVRAALRWRPPVVGVYRSVARQVDLDGAPLAPGTAVMVSLPAAALSRPDLPPLAFGAGAHRCPGAAIAVGFAARVLGAVGATPLDFAAARQVNRPVFDAAAAVPIAAAT